MPGTDLNTKIDELRKKLDYAQATEEARRIPSEQVIALKNDLTYVYNELKKIFFSLKAAINQLEPSALQAMEHRFWEKDMDSFLEVIEPMTLLVGAMDSHATYVTTTKLEVSYGHFTAELSDILKIITDIEQKMDNYRVKIYNRDELRDLLTTITRNIDDTDFRSSYRNLGKHGHKDCEDPTTNDITTTFNQSFKELMSHINNHTRALCAALVARITVSMDAVIATYTPLTAEAADILELIMSSPYRISTVYRIDFGQPLTLIGALLYPANIMREYHILPHGAGELIQKEIPIQIARLNLLLQRMICLNHKKELHALYLECGEDPNPSETEENLRLKAIQCGTFELVGLISDACEQMNQCEETIRKHRLPQHTETATTEATTATTQTDTEHCTTADSRLSAPTHEKSDRPEQEKPAIQPVALLEQPTVNAHNLTAEPLESQERLEKAGQEPSGSIGEPVTSAATGIAIERM